MRTALKFSLPLLFCSYTQIALSCTTIIVGKQASSNGKTMIARTSDTIDARRAKNLQIYRDATLEKIYIGLPYTDLEANPNADMAQVVTNKYGVSVSATETIQSSPQALQLDPPTYSENGVFEPNIPAIVMPNAHTAKEAVDILGNTIEQVGVRGTKGFGVLIADAQEAWYLETLSGHQWVAIKIPENVYFAAANGPGQIQNYLPKQYTYAMSHYQGLTPIQFAEQQGITQTTQGRFNFRATYADVANPKNRNVNYVRLAYIQHYFNPSTLAFDAAALDRGEYSMFLQPEHKISRQDLEYLQSSHYQEFPEYDPYVYAKKDESKQPFYYPIANVRTSNGHVTVVGTSKDKNIANIEYIALGMPTVSFYLPIYYGVTSKPNALTGGKYLADNQTLFWQFRKLQTLVFLSDSNHNIQYDFSTRSAYVQSRYNELANEIETDRQTMEAAYQAQPDVKLIDEFTNNTIAKISSLNETLIAEFIQKFNIKEADLNAWFTKMLHQQDCDYRSNCQPELLKGYSSFVDGPVL